MFLFYVCVWGRYLAQRCYYCALWLYPTRRTNQRQQEVSLHLRVSWCFSLAFLWVAIVAMPSTPPETSHPGFSLPWQAGDLMCSGTQKGHIIFFCFFHLNQGLVKNNPPPPNYFSLLINYLLFCGLLPLSV